jgi:hypothetical protein
VDDFSRLGIDGVGGKQKMQSGEELRPQKHESGCRGVGTTPVTSLPRFAAPIWPRLRHLLHCPPGSLDAQAGQAPNTTNSWSRTAKPLGAKPFSETGQSSRQKARSHLWQWK